MMKKVFLLSFLILAFTSKAFSASMSMIGEKGDPNKVDRTIIIKMYDNYYEPNSIKVKKGETIKFIVQNLGEMVHEYNIATKEMHIKHQPEMEKMVEHEILLVDKIDMDTKGEARQRTYSKVELQLMFKYIEHHITLTSSCC